MKKEKKIFKKGDIVEFENRQHKIIELRDFGYVLIEDIQNDTRCIVCRKFLMPVTQPQTEPTEPNPFPKLQLLDCVELGTGEQGIVTTIKTHTYNIALFNQDVSILINEKGIEASIIQRKITKVWQQGRCVKGSQLLRMYRGLNVDKPTWQREDPVVELNIPEIKDASKIKSEVVTDKQQRYFTKINKNLLKRLEDETMVTLSSGALPTQLNVTSDCIVVDDMFEIGKMVLEFGYSKDFLNAGFLEMDSYAFIEYVKSVVGEKPKKIKTIYNLEIWDKYFYIKPNGFVGCSVWFNDNIDKEKLAFGNIYLTKEDAETETNRIKEKAKIKKNTIIFNTYKELIEGLPDELKNILGVER